MKKSERFGIDSLNSTGHNRLTVRARMLKLVLSFSSFDTAFQARAWWSVAVLLPSWTPDAIRQELFVSLFTVEGRPPIGHCVTKTHQLRPAGGQTAGRIVMTS
jgi:hypothetical protein